MAIDIKQPIVKKMKGTQKAVIFIKEVNKINMKLLLTEQRNKDTMNIDSVSTVEMLKMINDEDKKVAKAVENQINKYCKSSGYYCRKT